MFRQAKTLRKPPEMLDKPTFHAIVKMVRACGHISTGTKADNAAAETLG
jgi:hypothetical protein